jgi:hypothetical protein
MANWKFTDDYGTQYPALSSTTLKLLVFSEHSLNGSTFTGTLDVAATGPALSTLGKLISLPSIPVAGTVTNENGTLSVKLNSTDATAFTTALAQKIPLIGGALQNAGLAIAVVVKTTDQAGQPTQDGYDLDLSLKIGGNTVQVATQVPMNAGLFTITGDFTGATVQLTDLNFLMGTLTAGQWFPTQKLGPYMQGSPTLQLLSLSVVLAIQLEPSLTVSVSSVTVTIGINNIALLGQALYLNPLGVIVTVTSPTSSPVASWGIHGAMVLCNYARPGDLADPDLTFTFDMVLDDYTISAELENPSQVSVSTMLQDLMGQSTNLGLPSTLTIDKFDLSTQGDSTSGKINHFSTSIAMSGGFGLFANLDLEEIDVSVEYNA